MTIVLDAKRRLSVPQTLMPAAPGDIFVARFDPEEDTLSFRRLPLREDWLKVAGQCPSPLEEAPARRRETTQRSWEEARPS